MLQANSLVESVIAIAIISVCLLVGFMVYVNVVSHSDSTTMYQAKHQVEFIIQESIQEKNFESETYDFDVYTITKEASINKEEHTVLLEFTIKIATNTKQISRIVSFTDEE